MQLFAELIRELDATTSTQAKIRAVAHYLAQAPDEDAAWAVFLLSGAKLPQTVPSRVLREAALQACRVQAWLFEECYAAVGDLAETIALLVAGLPAPADSSTSSTVCTSATSSAASAPALRDPASLHVWMSQTLPSWRKGEPEQVRAALCEAWTALDANSIFTLNKLITGGLRLGVSRQTVARALALNSGLDERRIAQRLMGYGGQRGLPDALQYRQLVAAESRVTVDSVNPGDAANPDATEPSMASGLALGDPYPFFLAHPLQEAPQSLGVSDDWQAEWKWDGIRAQVVLRAGQVWIWSRGEELVNEQFPEVCQALLACDASAGLVLDGELLAWDVAAGLPANFALLQRRLQRRRVSAALQRELPVRFMAYDLLEHGGRDLRDQPLHERRALLEQLAASQKEALHLSAPLPAGSWQDWSAWRERAREQRAEGLMLKHRQSVYGVGRQRIANGGWWKWKLDPMTVDAVLVYAQRGHGRRASLYTDYTFAVWDRPADAPGERVLLPFAKAYSGLTDAEIREVDARLRKTTRESFGPVRSVEPTLVFELGFEGISASSRHKSGVAVRFPRILRWRTDKTPDQADHLESLHRLIAAVQTPAH